MPVKKGTAEWKTDTYGFHSVLLNELYPHYIPQGEERQTWYSYHAYESLLLPEQRVAYDRIASDIVYHIRMYEPWMLDTDRVAVSLSGSGRKKQMGIVVEVHGRDAERTKRVSFLFNCTGQKLKQAVRFQTFIEQVLMSAGYMQGTEQYLQERRELLDEVLLAQKLEPMERDLRFDELQDRAFDMIGRIFGMAESQRGTVPEVLLRLMFGDTDLIVIDQRSLARRNTCTWYPLPMGKGLEGPMVQVDWEGRLQRIRRSTSNAARIHFDSGAVFGISLNLKSVRKPGQLDYITISLAEVPWSEWQSDMARMNTVLF